MVLAHQSGGLENAGLPAAGSDIEDADFFE
jgi:hypothetical protein